MKIKSITVLAVILIAAACQTSTRESADYDVEESEAVTYAMSKEYDDAEYNMDEEAMADMAAPAEAPADGSVTRITGRQDKWNRERYDHIVEEGYSSSKHRPLSTFSIDVDTAGYALVRRHLTYGSLPPAGAVRIEEMINYFSYNYEAPKDDKPFAVNHEVAQSPWKPKHKIVRIGIQGKKIAMDDRAPANLVFLLDVSGSMEDPTKLPLLRKSFKLLVGKLGKKDRVAIVVYAGASGVVLNSTSNKEDIISALDRLQAGGSTNGGAGIKLAYKIAEENFIKKGINRVILATDGDFNVGVSSQSQLLTMIKELAAKEIYLSVLGLGMGNYNDSTLEKLADNGNGNYAYIDTINEAKKVLVEQIGGTLVTIAKDVKIQVEFNPNTVGSWRLIGYENRRLKDEDFNNDKKDAGEIGAGHRVTALYEIVPQDAKQPKTSSVDPLKYQPKAKKAAAASSAELLTVKIRYKNPGTTKSKLLSFPVKNESRSIADASVDFKLATAVAGFGQVLRGSKNIGTFTYADVATLARKGKGDDRFGYRAELIEMIEKAGSMGKQQANRMDEEELDDFAEIR